MELYIYIHTHTHTHTLHINAMQPGFTTKGKSL